MNNLWKSGTKKAYHGYVAQLIIGLVGGFFVSMATVGNFVSAVDKGDAEGALSAANGPTTVLAIITLAGYAYYFLGINEMKKSSTSTSVEEGSSRLWLGAIVSICGTVLGLIPAIGIVGKIAGIAGFIITWMGYSSIKNNATDANAKFGGAKLSTSTLLSVIAIIVAFIPLIGWLATLVLDIIALVFAIQGWKALAKSELA